MGVCMDSQIKVDIGYPADTVACGGAPIFCNLLVFICLIGYVSFFALKSNKMDLRMKHFNLNSQKRFKVKVFKMWWNNCKTLSKSMCHQKCMNPNYIQSKFSSFCTNCKLGHDGAGQNRTGWCWSANPLLICRCSKERQTASELKRLHPLVPELRVTGVCRSLSQQSLDEEWHHQWTT